MLLGVHNAYAQDSVNVSNFSNNQNTSQQCLNDLDKALEIANQGTELTKNVVELTNELLKCQNEAIKPVSPPNPGNGLSSALSIVSLASAVIGLGLAGVALTTVSKNKRDFDSFSSSFKKFFGDSPGGVATEIKRISTLLETKDKKIDYETIKDIVEILQHTQKNSSDDNRRSNQTNENTNSRILDLKNTVNHLVENNNQLTSDIASIKKIVELNEELKQQNQELIEKNKQLATQKSLGKNALIKPQDKNVEIETPPKRSIRIVNKKIEDIMKNIDKTKTKSLDSNSTDSNQL